MKGIGYAISAGALAVAAFTVSPWWAIGAAALGALAGWVAYRDHQRRAYLARIRASSSNVRLLGAPADLPPGKYAVTVTDISPDGAKTLRLLGSCDCLANPDFRGVRQGGAVWGCPIHDPEHTAERQQALKGGASDG